MKQLILRHGRLAAPYNSYESLTFSQLADLSSGSFCPPVDAAYVEERSSQIISFCEAVDSVVIYASPVDRAQQTAQLLAESLASVTNVTIETLPCTYEIEFDLHQLFPGEDGVHLDYLRTAILENLIDGAEGIESLASVFDRAVRLHDHLKKGQHKAIYVTHGFFMRILQRVIEGATFEEITLPSLLDAWRQDYLEGYSVDNGRLEQFC